MNCLLLLIDQLEEFYDYYGGSKANDLRGRCINYGASKHKEMGLFKTIFFICT